MGTTDFHTHLSSFQSIWKGGFFVGDPLDRMHSPFGLFGYVGVPYAIALSCIRPYITPETVALEIGPGRGAYTKAMLRAHDVWCLDALPADHNRFWEYVGKQPHVHYVQVTDFACDALPDDAIDFMFSYDALCHVPFDGIEAYAGSLLPKLRPGAHCFWMVADFAKYKAFIAARPSVSLALTSQVGRPWLRRGLQRVVDHVEARELERYRRHIELPEGPEGSWWYDATTPRTTSMLEELGYLVVEADVGVDPRSPIIHFVRP